MALLLMQFTGGDPLIVNVDEVRAIYTANVEGRNGELKTAAVVEWKSGNLLELKGTFPLVSCLRQGGDT